MKWNLELIYANSEAWEKDFLLMNDDIETMASLKGKLGTKEGFYSFLDTYKAMYMRVYKLYVYASMHNDQNQKDMETSKVLSRVRSLYNEAYAAQSYSSPEILSLDKETILSWCEGAYEGFKVMINNIYRSGEHILDDKGEELLSNFSEVLQGYSQLYSDLTIVDNHDNLVTLKDGSKITVSKSNMTYYLGKCKDQEDRKAVFESVYKFYDTHKATLTSIYKGVMDSSYADAKSRGFASSLEAALDRNNIDPKVYLSLIEATRSTTAPVKRYYQLRKKYFNIEHLRTYDRFLTMAESTKEYDYETSRKMVLEALEFMGPDFLKRAEFCMSEGRVDVFPQEGKKSGAYSTSTYKEGPFILLNHTGDLNSAFTLAHECGHSIHTTYSNDYQPWETADYPIFVAEVASTFNEARFLDYMMEHVTDKNEKIFLLEQAITNILSTYYRQALFADFEYQAHQLLVDKKPVDSAALCNIMKDLYKAYYDLDLDEEEYKSLVWAYIPHFFYTPFYVYQYATSFSASQAIYMDVKAGKEGAFDKYIGLLKSGCSKYPIEQLKDAGVDMTTPAPFLAVSKRLEELVDALEVLLNE